MHEVFTDLHFSARHSLPHLPVGHPCRDEHSHDYLITVYVRGPIDPRTLFVVDYADVEAAWEPLRRQLHGSFVNDVPGLAVSTSENLSGWIYRELKRAVPGLHRVTVREFEHAGCTFYGK